MLYPSLPHGMRAAALAGSSWLDLETEGPRR
jgi:hypothetical protein